VSLQRASESSGAQHLLVHTASCTAVGKFAIDHNGRHRADAKRLGALGNPSVSHIENYNFTGWARRTLHHLNNFIASGTACTEHRFAVISVAPLDERCPNLPIRLPVPCRCQRWGGSRASARCAGTVTVP
jgi:hypothetical protein